MSRSRQWTRVAVLAAACLLSSSTFVQAEDEAPLQDRISQKFIRGLANMSTGWIEVPRQIYAVGTNEGWVTAALRGPFDGIGMFFARTVAGVVEVATFPVPVPTYKPIVTPVYPWEPDQGDE